MIEMSMTEFVKYEQEILRLKDEIGELKAQLKEAREVAGFYGNKRNWSKDYEVSGEVSRYTSMFGDQEEINQATTYSGKLARAYLLKYPSEG